MRIDTALPSSQFDQSFLSHTKDMKKILEKLFIQSKPYSNRLKRLLVVSEEDCLDDTKYTEVDAMSLADLKNNQYIKLAPRIEEKEYELFKSYIIISTDGYSTNATNPKFRDNIIQFDIICPTEHWDLGNFEIRPLAIAGYIDGIINNSRLSGIGKVEFVSCTETILTPDYAGYTLIYKAIHGGEDKEKVQ